MKQYNYIYKITNLANSKIYIGKHSTDNLNDSYMGSGKIIKNARAKYGKNAFKKEIIAFSDNEDSLNFLEKFYIKKYKSQDSSIGYNISSGGQGSANVNKGKPSWNKGGTITDEQKKKISEALKGRHHTIEARKKMSDSLKGRISNRKGVHLSDETREKMSAAHKGKPSWMKDRHHSDVSREKMSIAKRGRKLSDETRKKMSAAIKLRNQNQPKWITPAGEIKMMNTINVKQWHPDWKLIEE